MNILHELKLTPLLLAALLQLAPIGKVVQLSPALVASPAAIVLKWFVAVAAVAGSYHAVSGATTTAITSARTATGTNGMAFTYRVTTSSKKKDKGVFFTADPLPAGLSVKTYEPANVSSYALISGTPAESGAWVVHLVAGFKKESAELDLALTILPKGGLSPPLITSQPVSQYISQGQTATFVVAATGTGTLTYQWQLDGTDLPGQTNAILALRNAQTGQSGEYSVVVRNTAGLVTSDPAYLFVEIPVQVPLRLGLPTTENRVVRFQVTGPKYARYVLWFSPDLAGWIPVQTNLAADGVLEFNDSTISSEACRFYRATIEPY
ncbi:MAG: immunoglobulin domain-containing protein [Verrucomicrobia bacterium]|nr:immunoglobulin domain-containing protein [Verrucomicrobiota bacterium]